MPALLDGNAYKQLAKGGDDTRQDALMLQVSSSYKDMLRTCPSSALEYANDDYCLMAGF